MVIRQYDIVLVHLEESKGSVMNKVRPCVIISPDEMNRHLRTLVLAPMTRIARIYPTRVRVRHNSETGWIVVDQIMTVDRRIVTKNLGRLSSPEIKRLKNAIRETYVD